MLQPEVVTTPRRHLGRAALALGLVGLAVGIFAAAVARGRSLGWAAYLEPAPYVLGGLAMLTAIAALFRDPTRGGRRLALGAFAIGAAAVLIQHVLFYVLIGLGVSLVLLVLFFVVVGG